MRPVQTTTVVLAGLVWLVGAVVVGMSGVMGALRPPAPQLTLLALTACCLLVLVGSARTRAWSLGVDERVLVAFHLTRFVGIYFLVLYGRGELPYAFAVVGGWGDVVVATLAVALLGAGRPAAGWRRIAYTGWNLVGRADIVFVVATAARSSLADPSSMRALQQFPLNLLLTYIVPIIIVTHLLLGYRLARGAVVRATPSN